MRFIRVCDFSFHPMPDKTPVRKACIMHRTVCSYILFLALFAVPSHAALVQTSWTIDPNRSWLTLDERFPDIGESDWFMVPQGPNSMTSPMTGTLVTRQEIENAEVKSMQLLGEEAGTLLDGTETGEYSPGENGELRSPADFGAWYDLSLVAYRNLAIRNFHAVIESNVWSVDDSGDLIEFGANILLTVLPPTEAPGSLSDVSFVGITVENEAGRGEIDLSTEIATITIPIDVTFELFGNGWPQIRSFNGQIVATAPRSSVFVAVPEVSTFVLCTLFCGSFLIVHQRKK